MTSRRTQPNPENSFGKTGKSLYLEELKKGKPRRARQFGDEQFPKELGLLGLAPVFELQKHGIELVRIDSGDLPATVVVPGARFLRNKASVQVDRHAPRDLKR